MKTSQDYIKSTSSKIYQGFNMFIFGETKPTFSSHPDNAGLLIKGFEYAQDMAKKGELFFVNRFKCASWRDNCYPFKYGGSMVCNNCGRSGVDKKWWTIKVVQGGNKFMCHGKDFKNIQESENYAFGDTYQEAIDNYETLMLKGQEKWNYEN